jgi:ParB family chromosome partitioning protein
MDRKVVSVSPFRCRLWSLHDRLEEQVTEKSCREEIESFAVHGQLVPVLARPVTGDPAYDFEVVCGARRLFVARHLKSPLLVDVREMSDREAIIAMDIENRQRADVSPYERGVAYATWLRAGHFKSQQEIANALNLSASQISRLLQFARLPTVVVSAFQSPCEICEGWGVTLAEKLADGTMRDKVLRKARNLSKSKPRLAAAEVYEELLSATASQQAVKKNTHDEVVKDCDGKPLFRIRYQRNAIALVLPAWSVSETTLHEICALLAAKLYEALNQKDEVRTRLVSGDEHVAPYETAPHQRM